MADRHQLPELSHEELLRYSRHLLLPEVGVEGQQRCRPRACCSSERVGWARRRRSISPRRESARWAWWTSTGGPHQPPAADPPRHGRRRPAQAGLGAASASRISIPTCVHRATPSRLTSRQRPRHHRATTTSSSTAPTTSRRATWSTTPACCSASPTCTAASSASRARRRVFARRAGPLLPLPVSRAAAAGPGAQLRRRRSARRAAGLIGSIQAIEAIKLILGVGESLDRPAAAVRRAEDALPRARSSARIPPCPVCGDAPDDHELIDYEAFCGWGSGPTPAVPE